MPTADKLDLYKLHKADYAAPKKPTLVTIRKASYLVTDGIGAPGSDLFQSRIAGLYGMGYTLKFASKAAGRDFVVCKLEGLYGVQGQAIDDLSSLPKDKWAWHLIIRVPDFIRKTDMTAARRELERKGKEGDFDAVKLESIAEGKCVQMLHVGPYDAEQPTIETMRAFMQDEGLTPHTWHHEIYLNDPRRIPPERLKTILRQPVR